MSLLGRVAFAYGYRSEAHSLLMFVRYWQPLLVFPFFLLSLVPRKWATLPLWFVCLSIVGFPYLIRDANLRTLLGYWNAPLGVRAFKEAVMIMVIPFAVQLAVWLKSDSNKRTSNGTSATIAN